MKLKKKKLKGLNISHSYLNHKSLKKDPYYWIFVQIALTISFLMAVLACLPVLGQKFPPDLEIKQKEPHQCSSDIHYSQNGKEKKWP